MKKLMTVLLACMMIVSLAVVVSAYWEPEEAFGEVKFTIGKQTTAWNADGQISDGEYYKVELDPSWISYAINDNDTDAGLEYAKATHPELYMSWDENYIYTGTVYVLGRELHLHRNQVRSDQGPREPLGRRSRLHVVLRRGSVQLREL